MLNSLTIRNFRSLTDFSVARLGRVNLIVGKNNSGKSSVLEAIRIFAANAHRSLLEEIAEGHDEKTRLRDSERDDPGAELPFEDFFSGRRFPDGESQGIVIEDPTAPRTKLEINHAFVEETEEVIKLESGETSTRIRRRPIFKDSPATVEGVVRHALLVTKEEKPSFIFLDLPLYRTSALELPGVLPCSVVPTQFISINDLARDWDKILFTEHAELVKQALRSIAPDFEDLAFVETGDTIQRPYRPREREIRRTAKVKLSGSSRSIPLNSLGDGMLRVFQLVLRIFHAKGGILLIDEFENGLHYSIQEEIWSLIFDQAEKLDLQVFATTHSWDCIESFSKVACNKKNIPGVLFRVGKSARSSDKGRVISTIFESDNLFGITQADVEVR
ncbi:MAG: AAA family ATPase [Aliidongia sp.]